VCHSLENEAYKLAGEYNFLNEEIKSVRFTNLVVDIKDIDLIEDEYEF
jgi:hypothetical protein